MNHQRVERIDYPELDVWLRVDRDPVRAFMALAEVEAIEASMMPILEGFINKTVRGCLSTRIGGNGLAWLRHDADGVMSINAHMRFETDADLDRFRVALR